MYSSPTKLNIITYAKNKNKTTRTRTTINRLIIQTQKKKSQESNYVQYQTYKQAVGYTNNELKVKQAIDS